jgi:predicted MFS family arabinose efflux permease
LTALSALVAAKRLDALPRRRALLGGFARAGPGAWPVCALAPTLAMSWRWRKGSAALQRVSSYPTAYAYAADVAPPQRRATIVGRALFGWSIALVVAIPAGGYLGGFIGWRGVFGIMALLSAGCLALITLLPKAPRLPTPRPSYRATLSLPGAILGLFTCLCNMTAFFGMYSYLGAAIRDGLSLGNWASALVVLCYGLGFTLGLPLGGLIDRIGPARAITLSMAFLSVMFVLLGLSAGYALAGLPGHRRSGDRSAYSAQQHRLGTGKPLDRAARQPDGAQHGRHLCRRDDWQHRHGPRFRDLRISDCDGFQRRGGVHRRAVKHKAMANAQRGWQREQFAIDCAQGFGLFL